jgi:imidazolonepropionase-like amidohydrolase
MLVVPGSDPPCHQFAGTANASAFLGASPCIGQVRAGCAADLMLLDANPLRSIGNTRKIAGVMLRGRWVPRAELDRLLESLVR